MILQFKYLALNSAGRQPLFPSRMDDKFLATAVAKMKTDALSTPSTSVPLTPATAVSILKTPAQSSAVNGGGAGDSNICMLFLLSRFLLRLLSAGSTWDVNVEAAIPLEDAAHAAEDQVILMLQCIAAMYAQCSHSILLLRQAKRKERMVKEKLQKQMISVAEQQQRLNKVRMELEKLEMVRFVANFS